MKYLFDTNVCIYILKGKSLTLKEKLQSIPNEQIVIPSIVRFELFYGAYKSSTSQKTLTLLTEFLNSFSTINFDDIMAKKAGEIRASLDKSGTPIGPYDLIIAATAIISKLILISSNTREFKRINEILIEDWY